MSRCPWHHRLVIHVTNQPIARPFLALPVLAMHHHVCINLVAIVTPHVMPKSLSIVIVSHGNCVHGLSCVSTGHCASMPSNAFHLHMVLCPCAMYQPLIQSLIVATTIPCRVQDPFGCSNMPWHYTHGLLFLCIRHYVPIECISYLSKASLWLWQYHSHVQGPPLF